MINFDSYVSPWVAQPPTWAIQVAYNSMIAAFSAGGLWEEALEVFAVLASSGGVNVGIDTSEKLT